MVANNKFILKKCLQLGLISIYSRWRTPKPMYCAQVLQNLATKEPLPVQYKCTNEMQAHRSGQVLVGAAITIRTSNIRPGWYFWACYSGESFWVAASVCVFAYKNLNKSHQPKKHFMIIAYLNN